MEEDLRKLKIIVSAILSHYIIRNGRPKDLSSGSRPGKCGIIQKQFGKI